MIENDIFYVFEKFQLTLAGKLTKYLSIFISLRIAERSEAKSTKQLIGHFTHKLGSAPDPTKWTDWSVSVGSVTSPTDPTLGLRIEIGRLVGGRSMVG